MISVAARATHGPRQPFVPMVVERRDVGPRDVLIDVAYAGICHTDVAHAREEWGPSIFPLVPGHEIAGHVVAVGSEVTRFAIGDRAGVGVMVDSCRTCAQCRAGREQHCVELFTRTYNRIGRDGLPTYGGYSERIVVDEAFVVRLPDGVPLERLAPLMCAGITVYSPMRRWGIGPGSRVAVLGFGGLGHVAVQIARALGAHVTVLDLTLDKREDATALGAHEVRATSDPATFADLVDHFDLVLSTIPARYDVTAVMRLLDVEGVLVNLGIADKPLEVETWPLMSHARVVAGSSIGGIAQTQEMLEFCGAHGIGALVEVIDADRIDEAFDRLDRGDVRFRFVIDASTIAPST